MPWRNEQAARAYARIRQIRMDGLGRGLPRPLALILIVLLGTLMGALGLVMLALALGIALLATPILLISIGARRAWVALAGARRPGISRGQGRRNVIVRDPSRSAGL
ncbi:MAG: hypothetical protein ACTS3F_09915 [Phycisphaerales bacterium]